MDDSELLGAYATERSETAFAALVQRHIHFVYSSALRQVRNPQMAEEVTQAVFIILARKAGRLKPGTVLAGWFFNTARFVAAVELRAAARRRKHEQEAGMESALHESTTDASWEQIAPFLDEGLAQLGEEDRQAVLLRFFEEKSFLEVGVRLGVNEDAARMRVTRTLKSLRKFFLKRGLAFSIAAIATLLSANAVHAAPASLVTAVTATAALHGAAGSTSTSALVKGALKLMTCAKLKVAALLGLGILLAAGTASLTFSQTRPHDGALQSQKLADGSILTLQSVKIGWTNEFFAGSDKPMMTFVTSLQNKATTLDAEFKLSGATAKNWLVKAKFDWQFRAAVSGEDGLEFTSALDPFEEFSSWPFGKHDYYGYLDTSLFPRDSRLLQIQIQKRDAKGAPWKTIAGFTQTQAPGTDEVWQPERPPVSRIIDGMQFKLGEVTTIASTNDGPWNWDVVIPWQLINQGMFVTNWNLLDPIIQDSSGNAALFGPTAGPLKSVSNGWIFSRVWQSPDPRKPWKIQAQLAEDSGFAETNTITVHIPFSPDHHFDTNIGGYRFRIGFSGEGSYLSTELLLTNRPDLRLNFVSGRDPAGGISPHAGGRREQFRFTRWIHPTRAGGEVVETFAIGKNIPLEFVVQPHLISPPAN